jgi:hypothetical protein
MEHQDEDSAMTLRALFDTSRQLPEQSPQSDAPIDLDASLLAFRRLLGDIAAETTETPRSILEDEFRRAPTDEFWRATIGAES